MLCRIRLKSNDVSLICLAADAYNVPSSDAVSVPCLKATNNSAHTAPPPCGTLLKGCSFLPVLARGYGGSCTCGRHSMRDPSFLMPISIEGVSDHLTVMSSVWCSNQFDSTSYSNHMTSLTSHEFISLIDTVEDNY